MDTILKDLNERLQGHIKHLEEEFRGVRSGRPSVELVENISVVYFDQPMTIKQLGSLQMIPPREIRISVWDKGAVGPVMKAVNDAQIGFSASNDGNVIHANLSPLTEERREDLKKMVKKISEETRIQIRGDREKAMKQIKTDEDAGEMTEDDAILLKDKVQKEIDSANAKVEEMVELKFKELEE